MNKDMNELLLVSNKKLTKLKLVILIRISIKQAKVENEIHPVIVEIKIRNCSIEFRVL